MSKKTKEKKVSLSLPVGLTMEEVYAEYTKAVLAIHGTISDESKNELLAYVSKIDMYAVPAYTHAIQDVWRAIVEDDKFQECLFMQKTKNRGRMNKYKIINVVQYLTERGMYIQDEDFTLIDLYYVLRGEHVKDSVFTGKSNYGLRPSERKKLKELIEIFFPIKV